MSGWREEDSKYASLGAATGDCEHAPGRDAGHAPGARSHSSGGGGRQVVRTADRRAAALLLGARYSIKDLQRL
jgi:hypothetical protein